VTAWQLGRLGWSADAIAHRVATGWLVRVHRGVYLVGPVASARGRVMAAALACGRGAWVSHGSATTLWSLTPADRGEVHVLVAGRNVRSRRGIRVHRTARLHPADATCREGIPVTSLARTLLDLATTASPTRLAYHGPRAAFERDRRRDADLQTAGFRVLRFTWRRLQDEPLAVAVALGRALA
jgi:Transcriptional regulator, AbiEi antitoxin